MVVIVGPVCGVLDKSKRSFRRVNNKTTLTDSRSLWQGAVVLVAGPDDAAVQRCKVRPMTDRLPTPDLFPVLAFRSTKRTADRLDALRPYLVKSGKAPLVGELTRADLLRLAVEEGLICLERRARRARGTDD